MSGAEYRRVVMDAAQGLEALNQFIETRFEMADDLEAEGQEEVAATVREIWTPIWETLADVPRRAILAELHDVLDPVPADEAFVMATHA